MLSAAKVKMGCTRSRYTPELFLLINQKWLFAVLVKYKKALRREPKCVNEKFNTMKNMKAILTNGKLSDYA